MSLFATNSSRSRRCSVAITLATIAILSALLSSTAGCRSNDCEAKRNCTRQQVLSGSGSGGGGTGGSPIPGQALWGYRFGDGDQQYARAVTVSADDRIVLGGSYAGDVQVGATKLINNGGDDAWLAVFDADTSAAWARSFGGNNQEQLYALTNTLNGNIVIAGQFTNTINLGGNILQSAGATDVFVAEFSSTGQHVWSQVVGGPGLHTISALAVDAASGTTAVVGTFAEALDDGTSLALSAGGTDGYVIWLDSSGTILSGKTLGGAQDDAITAVAWAGGDTLLAGHFRGTVNHIGTAAGESDAFLLRLSPADNTIVWAQAYGNSDAQSATSLAAHGDTIVMGGSYRSSIDFGAGVLPLADGEDGFVVAFNADGAFQWQLPVGGAGAQRVNAVALTANGEVSAVGQFSTELNVVETTLANGTQDAFALRLNAAGTPRWVRSMGSETTRLLSVAHDSKGYAYCVGNSTGDVAIDGVVLDAAGGSDGFILKLNP